MKRKLVFLIVLLMLIPIGCLSRRRKHKTNRRKEMANFRKFLKEIKSKLQDDRRTDTTKSNGKDTGSVDQSSQDVTDRRIDTIKSDGNNGKDAGSFDQSSQDVTDRRIDTTKTDGQNGKDASSVDQSSQDVTDRRIDTTKTDGQNGKDADSVDQSRQDVTDESGKAGMNAAESGKPDSKTQKAEGVKANTEKAKGQSGKDEKGMAESTKAGTKTEKDHSGKDFTDTIKGQSGKGQGENDEDRTANKDGIQAQKNHNGAAETEAQNGQENTISKTQEGGGKDELVSHNRKATPQMTEDGLNSTSVKNETKVHPHLTEHEKARYLEEFRKHIQTKLQIDENVTSEEVPGDLLLPPPLQTALGDMQSDQPTVQDVGFHAQPESFIWAEDVSAECTELLNFACLGFENLKTLKGRGQVYSAKLWFNGGFPVKKFVNVYSLKKVKSAKDKSTKVWRRHRYLGHVSLTEEKTFKDVTQIVQRWMNSERHNHGFGLMVRREKNSTTPVTILHPDLFSNKSRTPFLEIGLSPIQDVNKNPLCTPDETRCCRSMVRIKAHDVFPQIIAPTEFEVTFCSGTCNDPVMDDIGSNYTRYIRTYRWKTEEEKIRHGLTPCCAPIKFRSGSILLYKGGTITQYDIPEFMPTACGCI